jgi:type I restriction enzyme R subunit
MTTRHHRIGKTLTSFKASQILNGIARSLQSRFVVDRKDLDYQTMNEFNAFKRQCVDVPIIPNLVRQLTDNTAGLTTIQKIKQCHFRTVLGQNRSFRHKKIVFILMSAIVHNGETHD